MKIKTSELSGAALDWAVEQALLATLPQPERGLLIHQAGYGHATKRYSTDWAQGGPISEREGIGAFCNRTAEVGARFNPDAGADWRAFRYNKHGTHYFGPTELSAKMRCFVASKLGDEVDVPEELCK